VLNGMGLREGRRVRRGALSRDPIGRPRRDRALGSDETARVAAGEFREDLYHRLCVVRVELPPLRERPEDIPLLVEHLLATLGQPRPNLSGKTLAALAAHDWPGNVRELRNVLERAVALAGGREIQPELLGLEVAPQADELSFRDAKERLVVAWERDYLTMLLRRAGGNISRAARQAGLDRPYLHRLLKKHGVSS
jgi:DNA-binding NtrC family response regulator